MSLALAYLYYVDWPSLMCEVRTSELRTTLTNPFTNTPIFHTSTVTSLLSNKANSWAIKETGLTTWLFRMDLSQLIRLWTDAMEITRDFCLPLWARTIFYSLKAQSTFPNVLVMLAATSDLKSLS